jgi:hypothetical protein
MHKPVTNLGDTVFGGEVIDKLECIVVFLDSEITRDIVETHDTVLQMVGLHGTQDMCAHQHTHRCTNLHSRTEERMEAGGRKTVGARRKLRMRGGERKTTRRGVSARGRGREQTININTIQKQKNN